MMHEKFSLFLSCPPFCLVAVSESVTINENPAIALVKGGRHRAVTHMWGMNDLDFNFVTM
jgi:hypothetical protein